MYIMMYWEDSHDERTNISPTLSHSDWRIADREDLILTCLYSLDSLHVAKHCTTPMHSLMMSSAQELKGLVLLSSILALLLVIWLLYIYIYCVMFLALTPGLFDYICFIFLASTSGLFHYVCPVYLVMTYACPDYHCSDTMIWPLANSIYALSMFPRLLMSKL